MRIVQQMVKTASTHITQIHIAPIYPPQCSKGYEPQICVAPVTYLATGRGTPGQQNSLASLLTASVT